MPTEPSVHSQSTSRPNGRESDVASPYKGFATRAIRIGQDPDSATGSTIVPIYQTATFTQQAVGVHKGFDYARSGNPTRTALERQLANLESARFGVSFGSGMAAAHAITSLLSDLQLSANADELRGILARVREHAIYNKGPVARETVSRIWREVCDPRLPNCA